MIEREKRIRKAELRNKITTAKEAAQFLRDGMVVATSGTALSGYPREVFGALRERIKNGDSLRIDLLCAGPLGPEIEDALAEVGGIRKRIGTVGSKLLRQAINRGEVGFLEGKTGKVCQYARRGYYGRIDVAVVEAAGINEKGQIIPATCVYDAPDWLDLASSAIIEINLRRPLGVEGLHDIYYPEPGRCIPLKHPLERIGSPYISLDPEKIKHIIFSDRDDRDVPAFPPGERVPQIAENIGKFLRREREQRGELPPLEVGIGDVLNGVLSSLTRSDLSSLIFYQAVVTDPLLDLIDAGKVKGVSCSSLRFSASALNRFFSRLEHYRPYFIFRPVTLTNSAEMLSRFGVLAINSGLEADIQGQINSSHSKGSQLIGGIAGSYDFARNSSISIFALPSTIQQGKVSSIVPRVSHVDHTEHEVDVLITEHGIADLRALEPYERAERIIEQCADPIFRGSLRTYVEKAKTHPGRIPILLQDEFKV
ncbi:MAG TPA: acetyl-CoA hydrolase/transferase C-terminal domain-containing protein [Thermodesulfobacteriota bacterium]|nr:acetyl-CoA hydrolase/transferase C-terminal domain-containing protein [Thermodesulfobacteriota bacterium]